MLLETPDRPFCKSEPPWPALSLASDELETCEALYGEALSRYDDRIEVTVEDRLGVVYRVSSQELARVEARGVQSGATTGDERLANAAYAVLQRFRGGQLTLTEALRLAQSVAGRWMAPVSASFVPRLFLAASPGSWLGLRQETASLVLDFFSPQQAAKEAIKVMQKYLERHEQFQPAGPAEVVVNDRLGARFERKLAQLRTHVTPSLVTPSLVFHGAPSQEVLRSICQRGFLLPGDWIEGTPDFLELAHGNVKGVGVYTSPCLDTAARYSGVLDSEEVGLVLVALAAPGHCWHEKSREQTQEMIASWFFPPEPKVGDKHEGWVWLGDGWHPCGMESSTRRSEARSSNLASLAFAPDTDALYDGRFHSRRFGAGTKVSEELVLGSTDQLLPLLLLPFARRPWPWAAPSEMGQQNSTSRTPLPPLPGLGPRGKRLRVLCGSNVHVPRGARARYPSDPLPEKQLLCSKVLADEQMDLWAVHVPTSIGTCQARTCFSMHGRRVCQSQEPAVLFLFPRNMKWKDDLQQVDLQG
ncbi:Hypothetical protein (Fragment) [Durusdinium trenchii]|uniref:Poly [ADP-ribose] polymerase n=1 Tax=Durusdinium trenchii TaxID=1381693 RepID=A0ABP0HGV3_9DINO